MPSPVALGGEFSPQPYYTSAGARANQHEDPGRPRNPVRFDASPSPRKLDVVGREYVADGHHRDDQQRHRQEGPHRPPQPAPESDGEKHRERIEGETASEHRRGDQVSLERGRHDQQYRGNEGLPERWEG